MGARGAHREGGCSPSFPQTLSCPQGGLGDGGEEPGDPRVCGGMRQVIPTINRATVQEGTRQGGREEQSEDMEEGMREG